MLEVVCGHACWTPESLQPIYLVIALNQCDWPQGPVSGEEEVAGFGCLFCGADDGRRPVVPDEGPED